MINYKPVRDFAGQLEIKDGVFYLNSLSVNDVDIKGSIQIVEPYGVDLRLKLSNMDMNDFLVFFMDRDKFVAEGDVSGDIHITGNSRKIRLDGDLVSYNGFVNKLNYKCFVLKAGGIYPVLNIKGTNVTQLDGFIFNLDGDVDLSDKPNLGKQIKSLLKTPLVNVDGKNYEWTLKRMRIENDAAATELKYLKRRRSDINTLSEEEAGILGLERKLEF